ncbi:adenine deaminase [Camelliibacillus cellulosilyticus]|uniref:Adenine deaminase n=1 Tax=Camelliibacillus cellulosilyticus TaxID=2174486 RepID=A0ABV9GQ71_9BACL
MLDKKQLKAHIDVASGRQPADLVVRGGKIVDVFNGEMIEGDVAITGGMIVGIGAFDGRDMLNIDGLYICPTFIDAHVHIESAMVTPREFARVLVPRGVATAIVDPHEIANVCGVEGLRYMLHDADESPMEIRFMLPSSVPATPFEHSGAVLNDSDLAPFYNEKNVLGLAEVMDYPSVMRAEDHMVDKLVTAHSRHALIDGHGAGLDTTGINVYKTAGILTDHECTTAEEAIERVRRGMYVLIREGSVAKDLKALLPAVTTKNARRFLFCTDDKHLDDLVSEGGVDHNVRLAIQEGCDPVAAIQMATLNTAECYRLKGKGAIAPGYEANFFITESLLTLKPEAVYLHGKRVAEHGRMPADDAVPPMVKPAVLNTVQLPSIKKGDLEIRIPQGKKARVIGIRPNQLITDALELPVPCEDDVFLPSTHLDLLKIAVIERHRATGNIGLGIVKGFGLKAGAIATTIAHDSHNLAVIGTNDADMLTAVQAVDKLGGGLVIVKEGNVLAELPLPIAGLMSTAPYEVVNEQLKGLHQTLEKIGAPKYFNPFLTLSFLSLPVIPKLKLTDNGLFDVEHFRHVGITVK